MDNFENNTSNIEETPKAEHEPGSEVISDEELIARFERAKAIKEEL